ncbi:Ubiquinone biosynthesis protein COQ9, mitochondrial [Orchesella cincta]|uniref:Ubiquinone biosynthesis protein COQ9, mitochondrial n=1 Tax=Orchesella cincta TaxID=48709 RepID=A0A1D2N6Y0_ORCCI|nr:Ubiquinone biosynthesis protein COQ9, mitochondrial [Orchesella cincta]
MNTLSVAVFAAVCAFASAGLLGAPVAQVAYAQLATYSNYGARISQSARPVAYAQVAQSVAVPAATYSTFKNRVSQSARPIAYAQAVPQIAYAQQAIAAPVAVAHAAPALGYGSIG